MNRDLYAHVPKVHCPKENRMVPILWCMGGFVQQRYQCPGLVEAVVDLSNDYAEVKCKADLDEEWLLHALCTTGLFMRDKPFIDVQIT